MNKKASFKPKTRRYEIVWPEDHELNGLEVTMRAMRLGELEELMSLSEKFKGIDTENEEENAETTQEAKAVLTTMIDRMAGVLLAWNRMDQDTMAWNEEDAEYEETSDTKLLPATAQGMRQLEDWEFMAVVDGYLRSAVGVDSDLGKDSNNGHSSLAELPMTER